jgi:hypothetical protein
MDLRALRVLKRTAKVGLHFRFRKRPPLHSRILIERAARVQCDPTPSWTGWVGPGAKKDPWRSLSGDHVGRKRPRPATKTEECHRRRQILPHPRNRLVDRFKRQLTRRQPVRFLLSIRPTG